MKDQDKRAVESMCRIGLSLESLYESFPNFPKDEIEAIYNELSGSRDTAGDQSQGLSINCS